MKTSRSIIAVLIAGGALVTGTTAFAQVDNAMIHGPVIQERYAQPQMMRTAVVISLGWHGDRYWDGHRYWEHDEWMRNHLHDRGPVHRPSPHEEGHYDHDQDHHG